MTDWKPAASLTNLRIRAEFLAQIRQFFAQHQVLEVETPLLASSTATDLHLQSLQVSQVFSGDTKPYYLQTSPEFAMKRLLAATGEPIFQIGKAFRQDEKSPRHNPEFTMLEWYRPRFSMFQLIDEVEALVNTLLGPRVIKRLSYREVFQQLLDIDPHRAGLQELAAVARDTVDLSTGDFSRDDYLHLLLSHVIEPKLEPDCFIYDYPAQHAALAVVAPDAQGVQVAKRFELFLDRMEIANGYLELVNAAEQRRRFEMDRAQRQQQGLIQYPIDEKLLAAMEHGLPQCSGVALGVDRLLMVAVGAQRIDQVMAFPFDRA